MALYRQNSAKGLTFTHFAPMFLVIFFGIALALGLSSPSAAGEYTLGEAIKEGKFIFNGRLRFENVDAASFINDADGLTFRARFGFETASFKGFVLLAEGDMTRALGVDNFNSTVNGKIQFPTIADPDSARLNRLSITYSGLDKFTFAAGRQRLILDNARFVGNVGFRQNEQTFDSGFFQTRLIKDVTFTYVYVWKVNRIFGSRSPVGQLETSTHLLNVAYDGLPIGKLVAFAYLMDIDGAASASNQTYGFRLTGKQKLVENLNAVYTAGYARQKNYGNSPVPFSLGFVELEGGLLYKLITAKVGFQLLAGNDSQSFRTPLATLHAFQGFADVFLNTPASGIKDLYFIAGYKKENLKGVGMFGATLWFHDFSPDVSGPDLGEEIDFQIQIAPTLWKQNITLSFKFASFFGSPILPDIRKFWITAGLAF